MQTSQHKQDQYNDMLIVDFPQTSNVPQEIRSVRFNLSANEVNSIEYQACDIKASWYSKQEQGSIKKTLKKEISRIASMLWSQEGSENITEDDVCETVGLQAVLSREVAKQLLKLRNRHRYAVLTEYSRQISLDIVNEDDLCRISEMCSRQSRKRAHVLAVEFLCISTP